MFSTQQAHNSSLFGSQNKPSLFASTGPSSQPAQGSLFGSSMQGGLGQNAPSQPQQQQQGGLFGSLQQPQNQQQQGGLFSSLQQPQGQQQQQGGLLGLGQSQRMGNSGIWNPNNSIAPREKSIPDQMMTLLQKWHPSEPNCAFQHYFYNNVPPEVVMYYGPQPGEDEKKWEEALAKKPSEGSIPVLARGFLEIGQRLRTQVEAVVALQARLHEINNSLTAMMQTHELVISVRAADARRKHTLLSQRCLRLATKVHVLRNRGYAMDNAEEALKKKLTELEKTAFDPVLNGRQEEIWARMSGVRARARFLQDEFEKTGKALAGADEEIIDEENMKVVRKILGDYDAQLQHLKKELETIGKDHAEWQSTVQPTTNGGTYRS